MIKLYYLIDQDGPLDGEKIYVGDFKDIEEAKQKAAEEGKLHFSIEKINEDEGSFSVVYLT